MWCKRVIFPWKMNIFKMCIVNDVQSWLVSVKFAHWSYPLFDLVLLWIHMFCVYLILFRVNVGVRRFRRSFKLDKKWKNKKRKVIWDEAEDFGANQNKNKKIWSNLRWYRKVTDNVWRYYMKTFVTFI